MPTISAGAYAYRTQHMLDGKRLLIVEDEFLIALDIQRILETAKANATLFARSVVEANEQQAKFTTLDLAIIEAVFDPDRTIQLARQLIAFGVGVVFTSSSSRDRHGIAGMPDAPVVIKPFGESELLTACMSALESLKRAREDS